MGFRVNEVIKHGTSGWKLDCLEFSYPPLGELNSVVNKLSKVQMYIILVSNIAVIVNSTVAFVCAVQQLMGSLFLRLFPKYSVSNTFHCFVSQLNLVRLFEI